MKSDNVEPKRGVLVGRSVTVRDRQPSPQYFTPLHRQWIGKTGRIHAVVSSEPRDNPLIKVGFEDGTQIVFFRLADLEVDKDAQLSNPPRHGQRGSHLP